MRKLTLLMTILAASVFTAVAGNVYSPGFTKVAGNSNCSYTSTLAWTANNANTMSALTFDAGTLSNYSSIKLTLSNFVNITGGEDSGYKARLLFVTNTSKTYIVGFGTVNGQEKTIALTSSDIKIQGGSTSLSDDGEIDNVIMIAIGGSGNMASGSVDIEAESIKLVSESGAEMVSTGLTARAGNNNVSYTRRFAWTGQYNNTMQIFSMEEGALAHYSALHFTTANLTGDGAKYRVLFCNSSGIAVKTIVYDAAGAQTINIASDLTAEQIDATVEIRFAGNSASGTVEIKPTDIYLVEVPESLNVQKVITSSSTKTNPFVWKKTDGVTVEDMTDNITNGLGSVSTTSAAIFGYNNNNSLTKGYFDIAGYNKVDVVVTDLGEGNKTVRFLAGEGTELSLSNMTTTGTKTRDIDIQKCTSIKAGAGANSHVAISSITFYRNFDPTSTTAWDLAYDMEVTSFDYPRFFKVGRSSTVCLPFDLTAEEAAEAGEFYEFVAYDGSNLGFNPVTDPVAYTPYLFIPAKPLPFNNMNTSLKAVASTEVTADGATFKGVLQHIDDVKGAESGTVYGYNAANGEFVKVTGNGVSIDAFRAYIVIPGGASLAPKLKVSLGKQSPTGIEQIENGKCENVKIFKDGQLFIIRDGKTYNAMGQLVK